ncbi:hypothetical protein [Rhodopseudomonas pseudopalustris]|nr:hypothetical protein [Rhodopseudomonas pseudopalustris]
MAPEIAVIKALVSNTVQMRVNKFGAQFPAPPLEIQAITNHPFPADHDG